MTVSISQFLWEYLMGLIFVAPWGLKLAFVGIIVAGIGLFVDDKVVHGGVWLVLIGLFWFVGELIWNAAGGLTL
jgi:hypothetical protein